MPKVTYLLISTAVGQQSIPLIVQGHSGKTYGYAEYDPKLGHHAFRVDAEAYEQRPDGFAAKTMAEDLTANMHRPMARWVVLAEVEPDLESPEGRLAQQVDELRARIAELEQQAETSGGRDFAVGVAKAWLGDGLQRQESTGETGQSDHERLAATFGLPPPAVGPPSEFTTLLTVPPPDLSDMGFADLEALFTRLNTEGANLTLPAEGQPSKVKYRAVLNAYYAKAA